jgi:hypothetical protein
MKGEFCMTRIAFNNRRTEPRFHPGRQSLLWQRVDEAGTAHGGWLADISLSGIRFYAAGKTRETPELEDRLEVHQFPGSRPMFYEVVWVGKHRNNCELGCSRIFPSPRRSGVRRKPTGYATIPAEEQDAVAIAA